MFLKENPTDKKTARICYIMCKLVKTMAHDAFVTFIHVPVKKGFKNTKITFKNNVIDSTQASMQTTFWFLVI